MLIRPSPNKCGERANKADLHSNVPKSKKKPAALAHVNFQEKQIGVNFKDAVALSRRLRSLKTSERERSAVTARGRRDLDQ